MPTLEQLVEMCRDIEMTEDQRREQIRSFVYGNCKIENDEITREMVDEAHERLIAAHEQGPSSCS